MTTATPNTTKPTLAIVSGFVRTEKPTPKAVEQEQHAPHTLDLLQHLPDSTFKRYAADVAKMCDIPANTSLLIGLGIVSSVASRCYSVMYRGGDLLPLGEYVTCCQPPAVGKSRMLKTYQYPITKAHKEASKAYAKRVKDAEAEDKDCDEMPPLPVFSTDATPEGVDSTLASTGGFFALASAEQQILNTLMGASYGGDGKKNNNDLALKGFNGEYHASMRTTRKGYRGDVVGAITCFAQDGAINTIVTRNEGVGLAERFLMLAEPNMLGMRDHNLDHIPNEYDQNIYNRIVGDLAGLAITTPCALEDMPAYRLSKAAWGKINTFRNEIEPHMADDGKYSTATMRGTAGKVDMHIMKIATLLAILDEKPVGEVGLEYVEASINIMRDMLEYLLSLLVDLEVIGFNAFENSIIAYLGKQQKATRKLIRTNKCDGKPWSEIPRKSLTAKINETVDDLLRKGIVSEEETFSSNGQSQGKYLRLIA
jgi:hypothetical protein